MTDEVLILTTGGTIDKVYFDAKSIYKVGEPQIIHILGAVGVVAPYTIVTVLQKDSLEITPTERRRIHDHVREASHKRILITHGTDTMIETARMLRDVPGKTVVLVGSLMPARFKATDAEFNIGYALAAAQILPTGVYLAMNGQIFFPDQVRKNATENRFEPV